MRTVAVWFVVLLLSACASAPQIPVPVQVFNDAAFAAPKEPVSVEDLFTLSPAMKTYLDSVSFRAYVRSHGPEQGLVNALYSKGDLKIEYEASHTRTAADTFDLRAGNCMSLVIMTAAFAKALNVNVYYQNVIVDETWRRAGDLYLSSEHVNMRLSRRQSASSVSYSSELSLLVDFLPAEDMVGYQSTALDEATVVAMYMNNRAVEAMLQNQIDDAYWWARAAIARVPNFVLAYNTLAVVYQKHADPLMAERTYRVGLALDPKNLVLMQNFAPLLATMGKHEESQAMARMVSVMQPYPPFYFFNQGMEAMARKDYPAAKSLFAKEVKRAPYSDEFHFWLGVSMLRLGESKQAREQIALALENSVTKDGKSLYSAKLAHLKAQAPPAY
jgi:Tfp pilus assembly protein PilF